MIQPVFVLVFERIVGVGCDVKASCTKSCLFEFYVVRTRAPS